MSSDIKRCRYIVRDYLIHPISRDMVSFVMDSTMGSARLSVREGVEVIVWRSVCTSIKRYVSIKIYSYDFQSSDSTPK